MKELDDAIRYSQETKAPPVRTRTKKLITSAVLDEEDIGTVKWLIDSLGWVPGEKRVALAKLQKKVGY